MEGLILRAWHHKNILYYLILIPLSWLFSALVSIRRYAYKIGLLNSYKLSVPIVIVGNINMGGSGKTPVVIWLVEKLKAEGYTPGVISRGYGTKNSQPINVEQDSLATVVGDEPLLIARRCNCPVWVGANRVEAGKALLEAHPECDVIISDDGLQHYRLKRDVELIVADQQTAKGQRRLPAGPLRESLDRLQTVDAIISKGENTIPNAFEMQLTGQTLYNLANRTSTVGPMHFEDKSVSALAGIGKPERFFDYLRGLGLTFESLSFPDHYAYTSQDLDHIKCDALIMTEKDAVKCESFAKSHHWVLPVEAQMDAALLPLILKKLKALQSR